MCMLCADLLCVNCSCTARKLIIAQHGSMLQVVSPFIDPTTSKKIVFLYEKDPSQMCDSFNPEVCTEFMRQPHPHVFVPSHRPPA